jgi:pentose-5-phosphate-3-epimerase
MKAGVALNPLEPASTLEPVFEQIDFVTVMSIKPGFPGRKYMEETDGIISDLVNIRKERNLNFEIVVDGGITTTIASRLKKAGVDILVLGYLTIFNQPDGITGAWQRCKTYLSMCDTI